MTVLTVKTLTRAAILLPCEAMRGAEHDNTYLGSGCTCDNVDAETYSERPPRPHQRTQRDRRGGPSAICVCPGGP